jgi:hypothetical protein
MHAIIKKMIRNTHLNMKGKSWKEIAKFIKPIGHFYLQSKQGFSFWVKYTIFVKYAKYKNH